MMKERIERKWEFVGRFCENSGYKKAAMLAAEIDGILVSLYGEEDTPKWKYEYETKCRDKEDLDDQNVYDICNTTSYCIACAVHCIDGGCMKCNFAKAVGECKENNSLFDRFMAEFEDVGDV